MARSLVCKHVQVYEREKMAFSMITCCLSCTRLSLQKLVNFDKMLIILVSCNYISSTLVHKLVHNNKVFCTSVKNMPDLFMQKFMDTKTFNDLQHHIKVVLILTHGQVQAQREFNNNKGLIISKKLNSNYFKSNLSGQPM